MKKIFLSLAIFLSACNPLVWKPLALNMDHPGPPEFKAGWKDGCESGLATYGGAIYKMNYSYYQNYSMLDNREYDVGWHESFDYCRMWVLKYLTSPGLVPPFG